MFTGENVKKHARKFISWNADQEDFEFIDADSNCIYCLYPLIAQEQPEEESEDLFDE